jgi:hypothetical protein
VGSPDTVARKIAVTATTRGLTSFDTKHRVGRLAHPLLVRNIELYATRVIPLVRDMWA